MAYTKIGWVNDQPPAINQDNLNHMDQGIYEASFNKHFYNCNICGELPTGVQGGCWIDATNYVFAVTISGTDNCNLYKWDAATGTLSSPVSVNCYHANSIVYRPADGKLYIANCYSVSNTSVLLNTISVVDYDSLTLVKTITSPAPGGIYSIAYDRDNDVFYSTNYRGTTEGEANLLTKYNGIFSSVDSTIVLDDLTARRSPALSSQGVQLVKDGIAYIPYYEPSRVIAGYDTTSGERVITAMIPEYLNGYCATLELEAITYNEYNDSFVVFATRCAFEIGLFKDIIVDRVPIPTYNTWRKFSYVPINVTIAQTDTTPATLRSGFFRSFYDAFYFAKCNNVTPRFQFVNNSGTTVTYSENICLDGIEAEFETNPAHSVIFNGYLQVNCSNVTIFNSTFNGTDTSSGLSVAALVRNSICCFRACNFTKSTNSYDILAFFNAVLRLYSNTYTKNIRATNMATVYNQGSSGLATISATEAVTVLRDQV